MFSASALESTAIRGALRQPGMRAGAMPARIATVVYRSRARKPLSCAELQRLTHTAQRRNRTEAITGVILYDNEIFYQWLEGPPDGVSRVMQSIRNDPRHTDLEILDEHPAATRQFGGWPMKLATPAALSAPCAFDVIQAPRSVMANLHRNPHAAPDLLKVLGSASGKSWQDPQAEAEPLNLGVPALPELQSVIRTIVVPCLVSLHGKAPLHHCAALARQLADLLIAPTSDSALAMLMRLRDYAGSLDALLPSIVEPAARALGDLWLDDECSEFDVTIGLTRLQSAMRLMDAETAPNVGLDEPMPVALPPSVLVVPEPGERHMLGAALASDVLWHAGWAPQSEFPASDAALQSLVDDTWFDALDLSLSPAFRREHWLPRVTATIAKVREASRNPGLVVIVGGRAFSELAGATAQVGANATSASAWHVDEVILRELAAAH